MPDDQSTPGSGTGGSPAEASGAGPTILSRKDLRKRSRGSRTWWYVLSGLAVVVAGVVIAVLVTQGNKGTAAKVPASTTVATTPAQICPLTGAPAPAPGGAVPARPALGIKIGNYPGDRPSSGLNNADIVFEEPVEGAITRLVAVL